jgi:phenylalanine ammonia-lyase
MDGRDRVNETVAAGLRVILKASTTHLQGAVAVAPALESYENKAASRGYDLLQKLRSEYLSGARGVAPAAHLLGGTKRVYTYVRETLKIPMHGRENLSIFEGGLNSVDQTIGQNVSLIYEVRNFHLFLSMIPTMIFLSRPCVMGTCNHLSRTFFPVRSPMVVMK